MKKLTAILLAATLLVSCNQAETPKAKHKRKFDNFDDSCKRYRMIGTPCAMELHKAYLDSMIKEYDVMYPDSPFVKDNNPIDSTCYPLK